MPRKPKGINTPHVTEKALQKAILDAAGALGWEWHHETYSLGTKPGYPDLTLVHPLHGVLWLELKASNGTVSPSQARWIERLQHAGQRAYIVFPQHEDLVLSLLQGEDVDPDAFLDPTDPQLMLWEQAS